MSVLVHTQVGRLGVKLKTNTSTIQSNIKNAITKRMIRAFEQAKEPIHRKLAAIFAEAVLQTNTVQELLNHGPLRGHLGIVDTPEVIASIVIEWIKNMVIRVNSNITNPSLFVGIVYSDYHDILAVNRASFISEGGYNIPWLAWLLDSSGYEASTIGYDIVFSSTGDVHIGRTGQANMIESKIHSWTLPDQYRGEPDNNFITEALDQIEDRVILIMIEEIQHVL